MTLTISLGSSMNAPVYSFTYFHPPAIWMLTTTAASTVNP